MIQLIEGREGDSSTVLRPSTKASSFSRPGLLWLSSPFLCFCFLSNLTSKPKDLAESIAIALRFSGVKVVAFHLAMARFIFDQRKARNTLSNVIKFLLHEFKDLILGRFGLSNSLCRIVKAFLLEMKEFCNVEITTHPLLYVLMRSKDLQKLIDIALLFPRSSEKSLGENWPLSSPCTKELGRERQAHWHKCG